MGNSTLTQRSSDSLVTGKVKASMVDAKDLFANSFKVVTERGTTYLMGRVTQREADRATEHHAQHRGRCAEGRARARDHHRGRAAAHAAAGAQAGQPSAPRS
jgi:hypothetical protein